MNLNAGKSPSFNGISRSWTRITRTHSYLWEFRRHLGNAKTASQIQSKLKIALATDKQKLFLSVDGSARQM